MCFLWVGTSPASAAEPVELTVGMRLVDALEALRRSGLNLVYSSKLVQDSMQIETLPDKEGDLVQTALALLQQHQLTLQSLTTNRFVVVRWGQAPSSERQETETLAASELPLIEVYASRYRIGTQFDSSPFEFTRTDMEELPGLDEDALRVTRFLPGTANNGFSAKTHIRGGHDDETLVLFDDIPMYAPYHFKDFGAVLGLFDPAVTREAELFTGVYPARYGNRLSAVMNIEPRQPTDEPQHELGLSLLSARGLSTGRGRLGSHDVEWLAAARTSVIKELAEWLDSDKYQPEFSDLLLRGSVTLGDWQWVLGGFFLDDRLHLETEDEDEEDASFSVIDQADARYRDSILWLHADRRIGSVDWRISAASSERHTDRLGQVLRPGSVAGRIEDIREANSQYLRLEARAAAGWSVGVEGQFIRADYHYISEANFAPEIASLFDRPTELNRTTTLSARGDTVAVYGSYAKQLAPRWRMDAGLRVTHHDFSGNAPPTDTNSLKAYNNTAISPRLAIEYLASDEMTIRVSAGRMTQAERPDELSVADGDPGFHGLQTADQLVLGVEQRLGDRGAVRLETYRKEIRQPVPRYENLLDPLTLLPELEVDRFRVAPDSALLYGAELSGRFDLSANWSLRGGYTWAEAKDRFGTVDVTRSWNQQHTFTGGATWRRAPWAVSLNAIWHSGWRRSLLAGDIGSATLVDRNAADWPGFFSADVRIMWNKPLDDSVLRAYLDIINATQRSNPCCTEISSDGFSLDGNLLSRQRNWLPRYALVGVTWEF